MVSDLLTEKRIRAFKTKYLGKFLLVKFGVCVWFVSCKFVWGLILWFGDNLWFDDLHGEYLADSLNMVFSCDVIVCGWLGSKYQLTNKPQLLLGAQDQCLGAELVSGSTWTSSGNCQGKHAWFWHVTHHNSFSQIILQGTLEGGQCHGLQRKCWMDNIIEWTSLPVPEVLAVASNRKDWKRFCWMVPSCPPPPPWPRWSRDWTELNGWCLPSCTGSGQKLCIVFCFFPQRTQFMRLFFFNLHMITLSWTVLHILDASVRLTWNTLSFSHTVCC